MELSEIVANFRPKLPARTIIRYQLKLVTKPIILFVLYTDIKRLPLITDIKLLTMSDGRRL